MTLASLQMNPASNQQTKVGPGVGTCLDHRLGRTRNAHRPTQASYATIEEHIMTRKMQAAQVEQFGRPLVLKELDVPTPGPGQILVKTEACGVCHTDLHARNGDWSLKPAPPFTPGHEGIGIVAALGTGVTAVKEGDRVGV